MHHYNRLSPLVKPLTRFRAAIRLFNREYGKGPYFIPKVTKAEARRRVRLIYPDFV